MSVKLLAIFFFLSSILKWDDFAADEGGDGDGAAGSSREAAR